VALLLLVHDGASKRFRTFRRPQSERYTRALCVAIYNGRMPEVRRLARMVGNVNTRYWDTMALHYAAAQDDVPAIDFLLKYRAEIDGRDWCGCTPLHYAVKHGSAAAVRRLIARGAAVDAKGAGMPHRLVPVPEPAIVGSVSRDAILVGEEARRGYTPLHEAARWGHLAIAELLIAKGADVRTSDRTGRTPLHNAASYSRWDVAKLLIAKGADVNARFDDGKTLLHFPTSLTDEDVVVFLLSKGADLNIKDRSGRTPLDYANQLAADPRCARRYRPVASFLRRHGAKTAKELDAEAGKK